MPGHEVKIISEKTESEAVVVKHMGLIEAAETRQQQHDEIREFCEVTIDNDEKPVIFRQAHSPETPFDDR